MSGAARVRVERPLGPNPALTALDEPTGRLVLADFVVSGAQRYVVAWTHGGDRDCAERVALAERALRAAADPICCVTGWPHETEGPLRIRHLGFAARLKKAGWSVATEAGLALGVRAVTGATAIETTNEGAGEARGWFLGSGAWCTVERLAAPPFQASMLAFCRSGRLAPSDAFTTGVIAAGGAFAYVLTDDAHPPSLVVVAPASAGLEAVLGDVAGDTSVPGATRDNT